MTHRRKIFSILWVVTLGLFTAVEASARELYVDSQLGDDITDGRSENPVDERSGPVKTIGRALKFVRPGDTVHIANRGVPYFESLEVVGSSRVDLQACKLEYSIVSPK